MSDEIDPFELELDPFELPPSKAKPKRRRRVPSVNCDTSRAGAEAVEASGADIVQREMVLALVSGRGPATASVGTIAGGITDYEIEVETGIEHSAASRARNYLVREGLVRDSGLRRKNPKSGVANIVWEPGEDPDPTTGVRRSAARPGDDALLRVVAKMQKSTDADVEATWRWLQYIATQSAPKAKQKRKKKA